MRKGTSCLQDPDLITDGKRIFFLFVLHGSELPCSFKDSDFAMHLLKVLKKRDSLRDHKRTHTGEKPFLCRSEAYKYFIKVSQILVADKKKLDSMYSVHDFYIRCTGIVLIAALPPRFSPTTSIRGTRQSFWRRRVRRPRPGRLRCWGSFIKPKLHKIQIKFQAHVVT